MPNQNRSSPAAALPPEARKTLALHVLAGPQGVAELARAHNVSRPFVYRQAALAHTALDAAFAILAKDEDEVIFYLPVTKAWLRQLALALLLICHSSLRGVIELFRDLLDVDISLGGVHNIVKTSVARSRVLQADERLGGVRVGAHDEIFQGREPVLVGVDAFSTYCYLLSPETSRDSDTWAIRLLELSDKDIKPAYTVADGGTGLRAGQTLAWPGIPCNGDVFHALLDAGRVACYLENRALGAWREEEKEQRRMDRATRNGRGNTCSKRLALASAKARLAVQLADDIAILCAWLRDDILALNALDFATRRVLLDLVISELRQREAFAPHRLTPLRTMLENQGDALLAFATELDGKLAALALELDVPLDSLADLFNTLARDTNIESVPAVLQQRLGTAFTAAVNALGEIRDGIVRASSVVENLNSRLRNYFFLRRSVGPKYLDLLRFFLNHRRFLRSEHPGREGKSPAELLTGQPHSHWLELLGYTPFRRAAAA
ncbi:MAG: hypothetical protein AAB403_04935 [Planctomycetota bacterium]